MSQIDSVYIDNYISLKNEILYFKVMTLLLTYRYGFNDELNYPLSKSEININDIKKKSIDIDNKIPLESCIVIASKILNMIDSDYDELVEDSNVPESEMSFSLDFYNKLYYDMLDNTYKNNMVIKKIFIDMLIENLEQSIKEEDYESAFIINNKISQINS
jgi:hypothetical protein